MAREREYLLADIEADTENTRLALLERLYDEQTFRRLDALGIAAGSRCLEVGAGRGSVARWLSAGVGAGGHVVAADLAPRFLTGLPDNVEVRTLDIRDAELEPAAYDLVHCRALLMHMADPAPVLRTMVAALRPGGLLLAEEADFGLMTYGGHPDAAWATADTHRLFRWLAEAKVMDAYFGRVLPGLLVDAGLEFLGAEVDGSVTRFGEPAFELQRLSSDSSTPSLVAAGVLTVEDQARARAVTDCPTTVLTTTSVVAAWGRRPD
ncbi:MAG TPA: class I SAM-dependent methyltransferase [Pseudonocardia sp.]|nr:class I SAM-dependent methyltransferase [Pseudonocardia sp.]